MRIMKRRGCRVARGGDRSRSLAAALVSAASAGSSGQSAKGGTYRVGWESSFGWTNSFDPTGEYLANGFAIYSNLHAARSRRFNHVAGPKGNIVVPDLAQAVPKPTNGGKTVHVQAQERDQVGAAREPRDHVAGRQVRDRAARTAEERGAVRLLLQHHHGAGTPTARARRSRSPASRRRTRRRSSFNLTQPAGDFPFRMTMPAVFPMPQEVAKCFEGKPGALRSATSSRPGRT